MSWKYQILKDSIELNLVNLEWHRRTLCSVIGIPFWRKRLACAFLKATYPRPYLLWAPLCVWLRPEYWSFLTQRPDGHKLSLKKDDGHVTEKEWINDMHVHYSETLLRRKCTRKKIKTTIILLNDYGHSFSSYLLIILFF